MDFYSFTVIISVRSSVDTLQPKSNVGEKIKEYDKNARAKDK